MIILIQEKNRNIKCLLMDPPGSGLFNKVTRGVMYTKEEAEGKRLKNPFDTITEGIGINRVTRNFMMAELDGAYRGTDREAVEMSRYTLTIEFFWWCLSYDLIKMTVQKLSCNMSLVSFLTSE
jgi:cysteine synthase